MFFQPKEIPLGDLPRSLDVALAETELIAASDKHLVGLHPALQDIAPQASDAEASLLSGLSQSNPF